MNEEMKVSGELDARVAIEVMGWRESVDTDYDPAQYEWRECGEYRALINRTGQLEGLPLWSPSKLITDAWMVVEKLRADGWRWVISSREAHTESWWVAVERPAHWEANHTSKNQAVDSSLPRAICLVALKAVEDHDE